jgi:hypothetical protein
VTGVETTIGVPLITPDKESNNNPTGNDGTILYELTTPPVKIGLIGVMADDFVKTFGVV